MASNIEKMSLQELEAYSAKLTGEKDKYMAEYKKRQKPVLHMIARKQMEEKRERDKNPAHKAKEQKVGIGK